MIFLASYLNALQGRSKSSLQAAVLHSSDNFSVLPIMRFTPNLLVLGSMLITRGPLVVAQAPVSSSNTVPQIIACGFNVTDAIVNSIACTLAAAFDEAFSVPSLTPLRFTAGIDLYGILGAGVMVNATTYIAQLVSEKGNCITRGFPVSASSTSSLAPGIDVHGRSFPLLPTGP